MIILQAELAPQDVRYSALYARNFGADEAQRRGLLDELQPTEAVLGRAIEVARDMASMPADGYRRIKGQVRRAAIARIEEVLATDADPMLEAWLSPEAGEAAAAVLKASL
jgi:enoyl-CoA hydratase